MFNKSKLASILEDEGLIKTAALKKGEVYLFQDGGPYEKWNSRRKRIDIEHGYWETPSVGYKRSRLNLAVEYIGGWSAVEKLAARYFREGLRWQDPNTAVPRYTPQQAKSKLKEAEKNWGRKQIFKVVGKWEGPPVGPYMPTKPWLMVTFGTEVRPLPQDDDIMPRLDDPNFGQIPMGRGGRDVIIPRGSIIQRRGDTPHTLDARRITPLELVKDIVARVRLRPGRETYEATIPFSTAGMVRGRKDGGEWLKYETNKGLYFVWPPGVY